ncbi:tyrosine-type recombinase/integrase [Neobacillus sp. YIM B02564]|uniref:Tyrosine-type recombinase/integrase n=1 Tax=Neobacillus paridis TaxID=2803862 RepID=A0ABS1TLB3_9BACI|nr:tyrosine-type recombinase/integrase [Neobacillus paridis]
MEEWLENFSIWLKDKERAVSTQQEYLYNIRSYLQFLGDKPLPETKKTDILRFLTREREKGNSAATRNRKLMAIRSFYKALTDMELLDTNPAQYIDVAKEKKERIPTYLDVSSWQFFLTHLKEKSYPVRNQAMFMLMTLAGLRVVEVHNMNIDDIHEDAGGIRVFGKGGKSRFIPVDHELMQILLSVKDKRPTPKPEHKRALFLSRHGTRITRRRIQQIAESIFHELKQSKGKEYLEDVPLSCHKLRHTFGTSLVRVGVDIRTIQELMGHENLSTTQIYTHVHNEQKMAAIDKLQAWYNQPK